MEKRSFILGLGVGIIFSVIVIWFAFSFSNFEKKELTAQEIEQKAKEIGMDYILEEHSQTESQIETTTETTIESSEYPVFNEIKTETKTNYTNSFENKIQSKKQNTETDTRNSSESELSLETSSNINSEVTSETSSQTQSNDELIDITINPGNNAKQVSFILQEKGVVKSADEFEKYLIDNHKTKNIKTGNYKIIKYIDFKTLSDIITKNQN